MKDVVLPAVLFYLLKQDLARVTPAAELRDSEFRESTWTVVRRRAHPTHNPVVDSKA
jgi:hypothetical protein